MKAKFKLKSITFKPNNIRYHQDFSAFFGVPYGIKFKAEYINDTRIKLRGPGYGLLSDYGNGSLYVSVKDLID